MVLEDLVFLDVLSREPLIVRLTFTAHDKVCQQINVWLLSLNGDL